MNAQKTVSYRGRYFGIAILVFIQLMIGVVHSLLGVVLLLSEALAESFALFSLIYSIYTIYYGVFTLVFAYLLWVRKRIGWIGMVATSFFVIVIDSLTMLDLLEIFGVPKFAAFFEIPYCVLIITYLLQGHIWKKYVKL